MPCPPPLMVHAFYGDPVPGLWCPKCLLPSACQIEVFAVTIHSVRPWGMYWCCWDCETQEFRDAQTEGGQRV